MSYLEGHKSRGELTMNSWESAAANVIYWELWIAEKVAWFMALIGATIFALFLVVVAVITILLWRDYLRKMRKHWKGACDEVP
jgi:hypothetical protein